MGCGAVGGPGGTRVRSSAASDVYRRQIWDPAMHAPRGSLPTAGQLLEETMQAETPAADYDAWIEDRIKTTLY